MECFKNYFQFAFGCVHCSSRVRLSGMQYINLTRINSEFLHFEFRLVNRKCFRAEHQFVKLRDRFRIGAKSVSYFVAGRNVNCHAGESCSDRGRFRSWSRNGLPGWQILLGPDLVLPAWQSRSREVERNGLPGWQILLGREQELPGAENQIARLAN